MKLLPAIEALSIVPASPCPRSPGVSSEMPAHEGAGLVIVVRYQKVIRSPVACAFGRRRMRGIIWQRRRLGRAAAGNLLAYRLGERRRNNQKKRKKRNARSSKATRRAINRMKDARHRTRYQAWASLRNLALKLDKAASRIGITYGENAFLHRYTSSRSGNKRWRQMR